MDIVIRELNSKISMSKVRGNETDMYLYQKIKMDYYLMLTLAAALDMRCHAEDAEKLTQTVISKLHEPTIGALIVTLSGEYNPEKKCYTNILHLDESLIKLFKEYGKERNAKFGHNNLDPVLAKEIGQICIKIEKEFQNLPQILQDDVSNFIRCIFCEDYAFHYVDKVDGSEVVVAVLDTAAPTWTKYPVNNLKARLYRQNEICAGDLFLYMQGYYVKVSPFIRYDQEKEMFQMLLDIESLPNKYKPEYYQFKMAYVFRKPHAEEETLYPFGEGLPREIAPFLKNHRKYAVLLNDFQQKELLEEQYYSSNISQDVQKQLDEFICGRVASKAVYGTGGVGKTSIIFMWIRKMLNNEDHILQKIKEEGSGFELKRIIFMSAKKELYLREANQDFQTFEKMESDISSYKDIINYVYREIKPNDTTASFERKERFLKDQLKNCLLIVDDFESLSTTDQEKVKNLKEKLDFRRVKLLLTTRNDTFEHIAVCHLDQEGCAKMTDHIFGEKDWRNSLTENELYQMTGGVPVIIWYAKSLYSMGNLNSKIIHDKFNGRDRKLDEYLFENFLQSFKKPFTKNIIRNVTQYYEQQSRLEISREILIFLCLSNIKDYRKEDEKEEYFRGLLELHYITIPDSEKIVDFSPLMTYIEKSSYREKPEELYQKDASAVLDHLNEKKYDSLSAVLEASKKLTKEPKIRVLERILHFSLSSDTVKETALLELFAEKADKLAIYEQYKQKFQSVPGLIQAFIAYITEEQSVLKNQELVYEFLHSVTVTMLSETPEQASQDVLDKIMQFIPEELLCLYRMREDEELKNSDLLKYSKKFTEEIAVALLPLLPKNKQKEAKESINQAISEINIWVNCEMIN